MLHIDSDKMRAAILPQTNETVSRMVSTSCGWLEVATWGLPNSHALILVSHGMGSWSSLLQIAEQLAKRYPERLIVSWSRPGCGNSPAEAQPGKSEPFEHETRVVLPALMEALDIQTADLLGHADGATVAMMFAALFPARTGKVVAIAPYAFADSRFVNDTPVLPFLESDSGLSQRLEARHMDAEATYARWRQRRLSDGASGWSALEALSAMTAPLLLIQGTADQFATTGQIGAVTDVVKGQVNWVLLRAQGHFLPLEAPEQVVCLAANHLADPVSGHV